MSSINRNEWYSPEELKRILGKSLHYQHTKLMAKIKNNWRLVGTQLRIKGEALFNLLHPGSKKE